MKGTISSGAWLKAGVLAAALIVGGAAVSSAQAEAQYIPGKVTGTISTGMNSTKDHGIISIMSDPTLSSGRLVLKVVAFNRDHTLATFGPQDIQVFTAAGQPVALMTLDQLVQEAKGGAGSADQGSSQSYNAQNYTGPVQTYLANGQPDTSHYTGGAHNVGSITASSSPRRASDSKKAENDPKVQEQIAALNAAILHPVNVDSAGTGGGQIVTEKIKFGSNEERTLKVVVDFNSEKHEFSFPAPPDH